jgi:dolichol-phosphate mannosyltransferase
VSAEAGAGALVIIPTYQERENIESIVGRVLAATPRANVLVVDDGSPDGTGKVADELAGADARVGVLHRTAKAGLGAAYIAGFDLALERGYDYVVEMDADGSHPPEQLPALIAGLDGPGGRADVVLGSRWVDGGAVVNWPRRRELLSRGGNVYTRLALGIGLRDATGGYRVYRRAVLEGIDYRAVASQGYCFQVDLARRALAAGFVVREVPITFVERERGESKMSGAIVREALWRVTQWGAVRRADELRALVRGGRSR